MQGAVAAQPQYEITDQDKARVKRIADAWTAYDGNLPEQLQETPEGINPNANSNRMEPIVFSGVNFLFGKPLAINVDQGSPTEAQQFLDDVWGINEARMPLLQDLATSGGVSGQPFLRIVPNQDGSAFNLVVVDPMTVFVQCAPEDCKTVLLFCIEYSCQQQIPGSNKPVQVFYHEEIQRIDPDGNAKNGMPDDDDTWVINHWTRIGDQGTWQSAGESIPWSYPFPPIFTCQNRSDPHNFWGKPDTTADLIQQNEDINLVQSLIQQTIIMYTDPLIVAKGVGEGAAERGYGRMVQIPPDGDIHGVPLQTDLPNALASLNRLDDNISEQSAIPGALARQSEMPRINSGIQMELMFQGLLAKTDMKRSRYGKLIIDVSKALLVLAGFSSDINVSLKWKSALPVDPLNMAQAIQALTAAGMSLESAFELFGIDAAQEEERRNAEAAKQVVAASRGQGFPPSPQQPGQAPAPDDQQQEQGGAQ